MKKTCDVCKWFRGWTGNQGMLEPLYICNDPNPLPYRHLNIIHCGHFEERKNMISEQEAYRVLQEKWVALHDAAEGDIVKVLRVPSRACELGSDCYAALNCSTFFVGKEFPIAGIAKDRIIIDGVSWPFFCLQFVKKAESKIKITCEVNGKTVPLSTLSEESILNIRRNS